MTDRSRAVPNSRKLLSFIVGFPHSARSPCCELESPNFRSEFASPLAIALTDRPAGVVDVRTRQLFCAATPEINFFAGPSGSCAKFSAPSRHRASASTKRAFAKIKSRCEQLSRKPSPPATRAANAIADGSGGRTSHRRAKRNFRQCSKTCCQASSSYDGCGSFLRAFDVLTNLCGCREKFANLHSSPARGLESGRF